MSKLVEHMRGYSEETKTMLDKLRCDISEDRVYSLLQKEYDVEEILEYNEFTIQHKLERLPFHIQMFRLKYLQELGKYEQVKEHVEKVIGEKYIALKEGEVSLTKTEIEKYYLPRDEEILKLKALLRKQDMIVKYFETIYNILDKQIWNIRAYIENSKGGY